MTRFSHLAPPLRCIFYATLCALGAGLPINMAAAQSTPKVELQSLQSLAQEGALVTAMVIDISQNKILAQHAPDARLTPASVSKLFINAAALEQWGPDSTFITRFLSSAKLKDGVLEGDLVFAGAGDPDLDTERLWMLITRLRQAGVHTVTGDLVVNDGLFGPVICLIADRCNARSKSDSSYDAPLSAAGVNFSNIEVTIFPAQQTGSPARLQLLPPDLAGIRVEGSIKTSTRNSSAIYSVHRITENGEHILKVGGQVPLGKGPFHVQRSVAYPSRYTASVLARMLADGGVRVQGTTRVKSDPAAPQARTLVEIESPALAAQLRKMMTFSNNYMADTLTLDLLAYGTTRNSGSADVQGPLTLPLAGQFLETYANKINAGDNDSDLAAAPLSDGLVLDSGSGLSITNRLSARDLTNLLAHMYRQNAVFPAFLGTLPVPLHTPSRSLKGGNNEWLTRVAVKTGSLSQPVSVRALAGYFRLQDGGWGAFAAIVNGTEAKRRVPFAKANDAIITDIESILDAY